MRSIAAVFCDLFDTVIDFDTSRLPEILVDGNRTRSTSGVVYDLFSRSHPEISFEKFHAVFIESYREAERRRNSTMKETPSTSRFGILFTMLGLSADSSTKELIERMVSSHMETMAGAMTFPAENLPVLRVLKSRGPLGLISNFDHAPTAHRILKLHGIHDLFDVVLVSDAVGWRKPSPVIFHQAAESLRVDISQTVFVGDSPALDVAGAKNVGMQAVWVNRKAATLPPGIPTPDFEISHFSRLLEVF